MEWMSWQGGRIIIFRTNLKVEVRGWDVRLCYARRQSSSWGWDFRFDHSWIGAQGKDSEMKRSRNWDPRSLNGLSTQIFGSPIDSLFSRFPPWAPSRPFPNLQRDCIHTSGEASNHERVMTQLWVRRQNGKLERAVVNITLFYLVLIPQ